MAVLPEVLRLMDQLSDTEVLEVQSAAQERLVSTSGPRQSFNLVTVKSMMRHTWGGGRDQETGDGAWHLQATQHAACQWAAVEPPDHGGPLSSATMALSTSFLAKLRASRHLPHQEDRHQIRGASDKILALFPDPTERMQQLAPITRAFTAVLAAHRWPFTRCGFLLY